MERRKSKESRTKFRSSAVRAVSSMSGSTLSVKMTAAPVAANGRLTTPAALLVSVPLADRRPRRAEAHARVSIA